MKKFLLCLALGTVMVPVSARETLEGNKLFWDNWSVGIAGGVYTPLAHHAILGSMRPTTNITVAKQITPIYGLAVEGASIFAGTKVFGVHSSTAFDGLNLNLLHQINLSNLFGGFKENVRSTEWVAVFGWGWGHQYLSGSKDYNYATSKAGLNINFNIGKSKAWQINVKPAVVWNLEGDHYDVTFSQHNGVEYDINNAAAELTAGVTYKFKNANGSRGFKKAKLYDQGEVDALNAKVNDLRKQLTEKNKELDSSNQNAKKLQEQLNDLRNQKPQQVITKESKQEKTLESVVTFGQGKSTVDNSQLPNVERIATLLKNRPNARVIIKGYASPEGNADVNARLAQSRAEAVKNLLIKKYRISADRIQASGQGVGNMFSEPDWNRVSISTIEL